jgi:hypothetical protein
MISMYRAAAEKHGAWFIKSVSKEHMNTDE